MFELKNLQVALVNVGTTFLELAVLYTILHIMYFLFTRISAYINSPSFLALFLPVNYIIAEFEDQNYKNVFILLHANTTF